VSLAPGQWIEDRIRLSDSLARLDSICSVQFHSPTHTVYVAGDSVLVAVDAGTRRTVARTTFPGAVNMLSSSSAAVNKLYCATSCGESVWVMNCATNHILTTVTLDGQPCAMCYAAGLVPRTAKVYAACPSETLVDVIDCTTDSVVARMRVPSWPSALCYNPQLNRIYVAKSLSNEVAVIDCGADTVISTIWVRGVEPTDICYDSATSCVYTLNHTSGTSSVIDCAGDSVVRVVAVGSSPDRMLVGPEGKVYCGGYSDSVVTVVESVGTRTIPVGLHLSSMSSDPVSDKVYFAASSAKVVVVDATSDTVAARIWAGEDPRLVCYDPVDTSTWAASPDGAAVGVIDGATDQLTDMLWFRVFSPGASCYNPDNDRLYCLGRGLAEIDCDSNRVRREIPAGNSADSIVWNPANNKIYYSSPADNTVSILDCTSDSITAAVAAGARPDAMCCSENGKVYVTTKAGGVAVIDPSGDSIRAFVRTPYDPITLCYDRTDNKVYAGMGSSGQVSVIDVGRDSVVATVPVADSCRQVCWSQNHDRVYVRRYRGLAVIDCTSDTVMKSPDLAVRWWVCYGDSNCDKVYLSTDTALDIVNAVTDTLYRNLGLWGVEHMLDNGRSDAANRFYCTDNLSRVTVIDGTTDSILRYVQVRGGSTALAWNPVHSWVYVSNPGSCSITVVSDTMLGIQETTNEKRGTMNDGPTIIRGVLFLGAGRDANVLHLGSCPKPCLLDISGRKVMNLRPGANDVRALAPGVYFVREAQAQAQAQAVRKVVVTE